MAFTKKEKAEMQAQYSDWLNRSQAMFLLEYKGMTMKDIDGLRARVREQGGELHGVKNTLFTRALSDWGIDQQTEMLEGSTVIGFAFADAPAVAKVVTEATNKSEIFKVKGGFLGKNALVAGDIKSLADLPPLPVMRARILGMINAPASQLARTIAEPARGLAAVINAHVEAQQQPAAA